MKPDTRYGYAGLGLRTDVSDLQYRGVVNVRGKSRKE